MSTTALLKSTADKLQQATALRTHLQAQLVKSHSDIARLELEGTYSRSCSCTIEDFSDDVLLNDLRSRDLACSHLLEQIDSSRPQLSCSLCLRPPDDDEGSSPCLPFSDDGTVYSITPSLTPSEFLEMFPDYSDASSGYTSSPDDDDFYASSNWPPDESSSFHDSVASSNPPSVHSLFEDDDHG